MKVEGRHYRTIWPVEDGRAVEIIDQTRLPHAFVVARLATVRQADGHVRGDSWKRRQEQWTCHQG